MDVEETRHRESGSWHDSDVNLPTTSARLIGRDKDLALLREVFADAATGIPRTLILGGEAGIGKTRLLSEFLAQVHPDALVLTGQATDQGSVPAPYSPITAVLKSLQTQCGPDALREAAGTGIDALATLLPALGPAATNSVPSFAFDARGAGRLHETVALILETLSRERPVVLAIEDLHWADSATLQLLGFLVRSLTHERILMVLTYRSDDVSRGHPLRSFLGELDRTRRVHRHDLTRLSAHEVGEQVVAILGSRPDPADVARVYERSEGVPFFVEELIGIADSGGAELPDSLRSLLLGRYDALDSSTQTLLRVLAVGGVRVDHRLVSAVYPGDAETLDVSARAAVQANVLVADERFYTFRHALVREAIAADLLPGERTRFHAGFAEAIETLNLESSPWAEVSNHWMAARNYERAFPATQRAKDAAYDAFGYASVAQFGERMLDIWDQVADPEQVARISRLELMYFTACALHDAGNLERSAVLVEQALADPEVISPVLRAKLLRYRSLFLTRLARPGSREALEEALSLIPGDASPVLRAFLLNDLAGRCMIEADLEGTFTLAEQAYAVAADVQQKNPSAGPMFAMSLARDYAGMSRFLEGDLDAATTLFAQAEELAQADPEILIRHQTFISDAHTLTGAYRDSVMIARAGIAQAQAIGMERSIGLILASNAVEPLLSLGRWDEADALIEDTLALHPALAYAVYLRFSQVRSILWRGDPQRAWTLLQRWRPQMEVLGDSEVQTRFAVAEVTGQVALAVCDLRAAWDATAPLREPNRRVVPAYDLTLLAVSARVLANVRAEYLRAAEGLSPSPETVLPAGLSLAELDAHEAHWRELIARCAAWPTASFWTAIFEAELSGPLGTGEDPEAWRLAVAAAESPVAPARYRAYTAMRYGQTLLERGERAEATEALTAAIQHACDLGATLLESAALESAHRGGLALAGPGRIRHAPDEDRLTAREMQVLELVAEGLNNRQIGERLYISTKTASVHVSAILRKLRASSRTEAAVRAQESGLLG